MKFAISAVLLLVSVVTSIPRVHSLKCYSCDTDLTDVNCNDIKSLPKQVCQAVSDSNLVSLSCGYQRVQGSSNTERIFRGCMVAGECDLLNRQSELTSKYRMAACQECSADLCNGAVSGRQGMSLVGTLLVALVAFVCKF